MIEIKTIDDKYVEINGNLNPYYEREFNGWKIRYIESRAKGTMGIGGLTWFVQVYNVKHCLTFSGQGMHRKLNDLTAIMDLVNEI